MVFVTKRKCVHRFTTKWIPFALYLLQTEPKRQPDHYKYLYKGFATKSPDLGNL